MNKTILIPISITAVLFSAAVHSQSSYLSTWNNTFPSSSSGNNASCQLCHAASTQNLNPYGEALCSSNAGSISNRIGAVTTVNSDMDPTGADNLTETNASTQPGWTPGNVNPTYSRGNCNPTGLVESPPGFILGNLDPATVNIPPIADAGGTYNGTVNVPLTFNGSASSDPDGIIVAYNWNFGNGNMGTGATPTHTYFVNGSFTVSLTVTDDVGASTTTTTTATIALGNQTPVANVNGPYNSTVGVALTFDGSASNDPDGSIIDYSWNFGDGTTGNGINPTHTYNSANIFNVTLTVMDDAGATDSASTTANITTIPVNQPPVSDPNGPYSGTAGTVVNFDGSASSDPDGVIVAYNWDFGDGNSGTGLAPSHTYATDGNYTVALMVTDDAGAANTATTTATIGAVNQPPNANPNGPYNGTAGIEIMFDGSASNDPDGIIVIYSWDFGDGSSGSGATPVHTYAADGIYTVTLQVTDDSGDNGTATTTATIGQGNLPPTANANGPYNGTVGNAVTFDGSASIDPDGIITSYSWNFGDGSSGTGVNPVHTYAAAGLYNVTLIVTDNANATDSIGTTANITTTHGGGDGDKDDDDGYRDDDDKDKDHDDGDRDHDDKDKDHYDDDRDDDDDRDHDDKDKDDDDD